MIGTISIEDVVKGVVVNGENVVDYDGIAKIIIPDPPEVPVKDVKVDGESVIDSEGVANITIPDPPVKDVKVDGESVVNAQGVANITLPDPPVKDVKVNGESVVNAQGVANVVVPVISNLRVVKQLPGVPAAVVTVSDAEAFTMSSLKVAIEPVQEGSGDPSPTNVRPISGWDEVNVSVSGVNVWDEEWVIISNVLNSKNYIPVKPNTQYYMTPHQGRDYRCFDKDYNEVKTWTWLSPSYPSFTTPNNCYFIKFRMTSDYGTTYNNDISINYPSTDTEYHAYNGHTYTIDLDGTRYGGELDAVNGVLTVDRAIVTFDDNGWSEGEVLSKTVFQRSRPSAIPSATNFISNFIKRVENLSESDENVGYFGSSYFNVYVPSKTLAEWKTLLSSTNMEVVYPLATPLTIQLTPTAVKTLVGNNNIFADSGKVLQGEYASNINVVDIG